jgi:uncharacterized protein YutE (UPF0331/DUF86 family)
VRRKRLGIPQETREAFQFLLRAGIIDDAMAGRLSAMVGFRNIAIHDYQALNLEILKAKVAKDLHDVASFSAAMIRRYG